MNGAAFERHYTAIADASPVPVLLYNFTAATGVNLHADVVSGLAEHPNIVGMKESGSDIAQIADLVASTPAASACSPDRPRPFTPRCAPASRAAFSRSRHCSRTRVSGCSSWSERQYDDARRCSGRSCPSRG